MLQGLMHFNKLPFKRAIKNIMSNKIKSLSFRKGLAALRIFLLGMMGSGKSYWAQRIAEKENMQWMNEHGITIFIDEDVNVLIERLKKEKAHRPLIKDLSDEELHNFLSNKLKERYPFYSQAQYHLKGNNISDLSFAEILKQFHE